MELLKQRPCSLCARSLLLLFIYAPCYLPEQGSYHSQALKRPFEFSALTILYATSLMPDSKNSSKNKQLNFI